MSEQLKIKLSIANRVYPLTISPDQEEGLRKAAKKIETMIIDIKVKKKPFLDFAIFIILMFLFQTHSIIPEHVFSRRILFPPFFLLRRRVTNMLIKIHTLDWANKRAIETTPGFICIRRHSKG